MKKVKRREFLTQSSAALIASTPLLGTACTPQSEEKKMSAPYINFNQAYQWKMVTTWSPNFPILGEGCNLFAQWIKEMSGGRMEVTVYGGGELVPSLEVFDAVSSGAIELGHGASYYWAGKIPAAQFFSTVPFGMNAQQMNDWLISGNGLSLWEETYVPFNLQPFPAGNTGMQMGGWFNKEIKSVEDIQGLKMRIPGIGGKVFTRAGGTAVLSAGGEIYTNLERGVIDATEWIGPYHDYIMGFQDVAQYYYYPGWHEPGTALELLVNKPKYQELPSDLQAIIRVAAYRLNGWMFAQAEAMNAVYMKKIKEEGKVEIQKFPDSVLDIFRKNSKEVVNEIIANDPLGKKAYDSYKAFQEKVSDFSQYTEKIYYGSISL